jgi:hypothetical protein
MKNYIKNNLFFTIVISIMIVVSCYLANVKLGEETSSIELEKNSNYYFIALGAAVIYATAYYLDYKKKKDNV